MLLLTNQYSVLAADELIVPIALAIDTGALGAEAIRTDAKTFASHTIGAYATIRTVESA